MKKLLLALTLSSAMLLAQSTPAFAQYWPYRYLYWGQALLYPLTRGLTGTLLYGPYNANPLYSASYFMKRSAGMASQWPYVYGYNPTMYANYGYRNAGLPPNYNYGLSQQDFSGTDGDDASLYRNQSPPQAQQQPVQSAAPFHLPGAGQSYYPNGSGQVLPPPVMPSVPAVPLAGGTVQGGSPLAQGFIDHLNSKYQGDLSKALSNSDTRSWAKAMGLIDESVSDGSYIPTDRLETLSRILKDGSLDPVSKLDTMRILLRKNTAQ